MVSNGPMSALVPPTSARPPAAAAVPMNRIAATTAICRTRCERRTRDQPAFDLRRKDFARLPPERAAS